MAVAIDFETYLISEEQPIPKPVCLSYYDGKTAGLCVGMDEMRAKLKEILGEAIIAHNAKFEFLVIYTWFPEFRDIVWEMYDGGQIYCTQVYELLTNNSRSKKQHSTALASLVKLYFEEDISASKKEDAWRLRYSELEGVPKDEWPVAAVEYAIDDSIWAYKIYELQLVHPQDLRESVQADFSLNLMAATGILINQERVHQLDGEIHGLLEPMYEQLLTAELIVPNLAKDGYSKKMKRIKDYIKEKIPKQYRRYTTKGGIATDEEAMKLYNSVCEDANLEALKSVKRYEKIRDAYINNIKTARPYLRTSYNPIVSSGRTSCRKSGAYPSVNIQNMPRKVEGVTWDIRNCCVARPGYRMVSIDYSSLELSATAQQLQNVYGKSSMLDLLNSGEEPTDMHSMFGARLKSISDKKLCRYQDFVQHKKEPGYENFRRLAKPINLGFPGGIGYDTMRGLLLREGVNPKITIIYETESEREGKALVQLLRERGYKYLRLKRFDKKTYHIVYDEIVRIKEEFLALYPELKDFLWHGNEKFKTGKIKYLPNIYGEFEPEEMYAFQVADIKRDFCTYTSFCNGFLMQTPSAIGAKRAMYNIIKKYFEDEDMIPLAFIHDEILFEVKGDRTEEIIEDVADILIDGMQSVLPDVRISVEATTMDYWKKEGGAWSETYWKNVKENKLKRQS